MPPPPTQDVLPKATDVALSLVKPASTLTQAIPVTTGETVITVQCGVEEKPDKSEGKKDVTRTKPKKRFACTQCSARYTKNLALTKHINSVHLRLKVE